MLTMVRGRGRVIEFDELPNSAMQIRCTQCRTLTDVAALVGVKPQAVSEFENTGQGIGRESQWKLAIALGVDFDALLKPGKKFDREIRKRLDVIK